VLAIKLSGIYVAMSGVALDDDKVGKNLSRKGAKAI